MDNDSDLIFEQYKRTIPVEEGIGDTIKGAAGTVAKAAGNVVGGVQKAASAAAKSGPGQSFKRWAFGTDPAKGGALRRVAKGYDLYSGEESRLERKAAADRAAIMPTIIQDVLKMNPDPPGEYPIYESSFHARERNIEIKLADKHSQMFDHLYKESQSNRGVVNVNHQEFGPEWEKGLQMTVKYIPKPRMYHNRRAELQRFLTFLDAWAPKPAFAGIRSRMGMAANRSESVQRHALPQGIFIMDPGATHQGPGTGAGDAAAKNYVTLGGPIIPSELNRIFAQDFIVDETGQPVSASPDKVDTELLEKLGLAAPTTLEVAFSPEIANAMFGTGTIDSGKPVSIDEVIDNVIRFVEFANTGIPGDESGLQEAAAPEGYSGSYVLIAKDVSGEQGKLLTIQGLEILSRAPAGTEQKYSLNDQPMQYNFLKREVESQHTGVIHTGTDQQTITISLPTGDVQFTSTHSGTGDADSEITVKLA